MIDKVGSVLIDESELNGLFFVSTDQARNLWLATVSTEVTKYYTALPPRN
jgi:hypothetical protein